MMPQDRYVSIENLQIHYQTRGTGPCKLLFIHGAVGSTNDFAIQMSDERFLDGQQFTLVAFDLPGFGKSEVPQDFKCDPTRGYFEFCAKIGARLMAKLGHKTYTVCGWSDGARVASLLAIEYQSRVDALLLWAFLPLIDKQSTDAISRTRDTGIWDKQALANYSAVYGERIFSDLWRRYVDFVVASQDKKRDFDDDNWVLLDLRADLCKIKCPTMVLHGAQDPIVNFDEHIKPLEMQIYDSDLKQFKWAAHNIHQTEPTHFNQVLSTFATSVRA